MKQYEAVIKTIEENGGYATLGYLYQNVFRIKECKWKTKTPFASIRRIVQDDRFFFKIKPGLWALRSYKNKLPPDIFSAKKVLQSKQAEFTHSYYQGLLVEIGNLKNYETFVPNQDKNKKYLEKKLSDLTSIKEFYPFGYEHIIRKAKTIDVSWFNIRKMPHNLFEIEHSTDIQSSLLKFTELQDFNVNFFIIADKRRKQEFSDKIFSDAFTPINKRVQFLDYDNLADWHTKTFEIVSLERNFRL